MNTQYFWACDYEKNTGEGNLARLYLQKTNGKKIIISCKKLFTNKFIYKILNYKYISPFVGIFVCWYFYLQKKKITYVNYLPLWNFLIFLLLPPSTKVGPITGGAYFSKNSQYLIRNFIFPILYKISEKIINLRYEKILFSTSLLKKYLSEETIKKSLFNYIFNYIKIKKIKNKKIIDFLIYYREHTNKKNMFNYNFFEKILKKKKEIYIVGDKLTGPNLKNLGYISNKKLVNLLGKTKYTLTSNENIFSLFNIECINNNVKIFADKKNIPKHNVFRNKFIPIQ
jgi:hypothetical protein